MARERMAKSVKYEHVEGRMGHVVTHAMTFQILHQTGQTYTHRFLSSSLSDEGLELTVRSAML